MDEPLPERRVIYRGRKVDLALQPVRLSDGSMADREVVVHRGAVAMVPMVDRDHVCLVKNFRYTVGRTGGHLESWRNFCTQEGNR